MKNSAPPPKLDPFEMFCSAYAYRVAANRLKPIDRSGEPNLAVPYVVLAGVSLEILLKAVLKDEGTDFKKLHDLSALFNAISEGTKDKIRKEFQPHIKRHQKGVESFYRNQGISAAVPLINVDSLIEVSKQAFQKFRYHYEGNLEFGTGWWADDVFVAIMHVVLSQHPDWTSKSQN